MVPADSGTSLAEEPCTHLLNMYMYEVCCVLHTVVYNIHVHNTCMCQVVFCEVNKHPSLPLPHLPLSLSHTHTEDEELTPQLEELEAELKFNFITHCFFLTHKSLTLGQQCVYMYTYSIYMYTRVHVCVCVCVCVCVNIHVHVHYTCTYIYIHVPLVGMSQTMQSFADLMRLYGKVKVLSTFLLRTF